MLRNFILTLLIFTHSGYFLFSQGLIDEDKNYVSGEFVIQITEGTDPFVLFEKNENPHGIKVERELSDIMRAWLVSFDTNKNSHDEVYSHLSRIKQVISVSHNYKVELRETTPDDLFFSNQWHHKNTGQSGGTPGADIKSVDAWDITTGGLTATGDTIVVCVIEAVNTNNPDLAPIHWKNHGEIPENGVDDDGNGYVDDYLGWNVENGNDNVFTLDNHGSRVTGMIGAKGNNEIGVSGVNWDIKVIVVSGENPLSYANIIECYTYPLKMRQEYDASNGEKGAFVVATNASWGINGGDPDDVPLWCQFYDTLGYYGILNCGATTNSNQDVDVVGDLPTSCPSPYMIGIGSTNVTDNKVGGYGKNTIDLGAPGIGVWTTTAPGNYGPVSGTSFSSPLTAGVIALMYSIPCTSFMNFVKLNPKGGADEVRDALLMGVDVKPQLEDFYVTGGRLNAKNAIDILMDETCKPCAIEFTNVVELPCASEDDFTYKITGSLMIDFLSFEDTIVIFHSDEIYTHIVPPFDTLVDFELNNIPANGQDYFMVASFSSDTSCSVIIQGTNRQGCSKNIASAFTPNGDNVNDIWHIRDVEGFTNNKVTIFNRWGLEINAFSNYDNLNIFWDGRNKNGENLPAGTYFYILESDNNKPIKGWVEILR